MTPAKFTYYPLEERCPTAAADKARLGSLDEAAFDRAVGAFHRTYAYAFQPSLPSEHEEAHQEALREALEAFLGAYEETRR